MPTVESKPKKLAPIPKPTKLCLKCGRVRQATDYYNNKDWEEQLGKDAWCKECVNRCATKEDIREYFWENHREFTENIWNAAKAKAEKLILNNVTYQKAGDQRRAALLERQTALQIPTVMGNFYKYQDNTKDGTLSYYEAKKKGAVTETEDDEGVSYSEEFNGYFSKKDLKYLRDYYMKLEEDFNFDNESLRDYAKKVCKASLQADKTQDDYAAGRCQVADVKDALTLFDTLSKSANFAACRRKAGDSSGLTSWAETTYKLETTGHTMQTKIEWPEDDVDRVINAMRHIVQSIGN